VLFKPVSSIRWDDKKNGFTLLATGPSSDPLFLPGGSIDDFFSGYVEPLHDGFSSFCQKDFSGLQIEAI
jgi:hypothetical protein